MKFQTLIRCTLRRVINLRKQAAHTMGDVSDASKKIADSADWATLALISVTGVAVVALLIAVVALERASYER
jgi:hypothetical protein